MLSYDNYCYQMKSILKENHTFGSRSNFEKQKPKDAAKKHAVAEQWRRWRINGHYRKLRELLHPNMSSKMVKASILMETVRHVKTLRKRATEVGLHQDKDGWFLGGYATSHYFMLPSECDEATVCPNKSDMVKVTLCCENRVGLTRDLTEAIRTTGGKAVRAEVTMVGGRTMAEVVVRWPKGGGGEEEVRSLRRALKALVDNRDLGCNELGQLLGVNGHCGLGLERPNSNRVMVTRSRNNNWDWGSIFGSK